MSLIACSKESIWQQSIILLPPLSGYPKGLKRGKFSTLSYNDSSFSRGLLKGLYNAFYLSGKTLDPMRDLIKVAKVHIRKSFS